MEVVKAKWNAEGAKQKQYQQPTCRRFLVTFKQEGRNKLSGGNWGTSTLIAFTPVSLQSRNISGDNKKKQMAAVSCTVFHNNELVDPHLMLSRRNSKTSRGGKSHITIVV